jgi:Tol biopolymer transport system component
MALTPGTRLGSYEVLSSLGAGGMGEVYRARDTELDRTVALKVLPAAFAADTDRVMRFEREAKTLAALNHPNIAAIYGLERSPTGSAQAGTTALVIEFVEGEDLSALIALGPMAPADVLPIAKQIAEALEAAHEQGIIHRDLKPANVKVRHNGTVKVLDFGLAKAMEPAQGSGLRAQGELTNSPTITSPAPTAMGMILGTAAYMSPEQARGRPVDKRADIWAFGVVLFEMLTGRPLYHGESVSEVLAAVIKDTPDLSALPATTPQALRALLKRCLDRDPRKRLRDIGEARVLLESPTALDDGATASVVLQPAKGRSSLIWAATLAGALAIGASAGWMLKQPPGIDLPVRRLEIQTPDRQRVVEAAISPDGRAVAFSTLRKAWIRRLDQAGPIEIPGGGPVRAFFWSPDGSQLGFQARGSLWKVPSTGGTPVEIGVPVQDLAVAGGAMWLPGDRIVYSTGNTGLLEISADGGETRRLLDPDPKKEIDFHEPSALPDGKGVLFVPHRTGPTMAIVLFDGRTRHEIYRSTSRLRYPVYSPTGHLLFSRDGSIMALAFDLASGTVSGEPFLVAADSGRPTVSSDGTLVVLPEAAPSDLQLAWVTREGKPIATVGPGGMAIRLPRVSPDGRQVAVQISDWTESDIYIFDVAKGTDRRLTFDPGFDSQPVWSPDNKYVVYGCGAAAVCARPADGSGDRVILIDDARAPAVSHDGKSLLFVRENAGSPDIFVVDIGPTGFAAPATSTPRPLVTGAGRQASPEVSPDGKLVAYESTETGESDIFITTFPAGQGRWQVSKGGGTSPRWSGSGDRLYFELANHLMESVIERTPAPAPDTPKDLLAGEALAVRLATFGFDRSADDSRFLVPRPTNALSDNGALLLIEQWAKAHVRK